MTHHSPPGRTFDFWFVAIVLLFTLAVAFALPLAQDDLLPIGAFALPLLVLLGVILAYKAMAGDEVAIALLIFVATFMAEAIFRKRAYSDKSIDFQVIVKVGLWLMIMLPAIAAMYRARFRTVEHVGVIWIALYGWFALTTIWSPNFLYSAVAIVSACAYLFFFTTVMAHFDRFLVVRIVIYSIACFCLVSLVVYFAVPSLGRMPVFTTGQAMVATGRFTNRLTGISSTANAAGFISALGLLLSTIYWSRLRALDRLFFYGAVALCLSVLLLSQSRMSLVAVLLLGFFYHFAYLRRAHFVAFIIAAGLMTVLLIASFQNEAISLLSRSGSLDEITTFTGRSSIWAVVLKLIAVKPFQGWGYASSVFVLTPYSHDVGFSSISQAHNLLLQLVLTTGLIGLLLFVLAVADFLLRVHINRRRDALTVFLFVMFVGLTEPGPFFGMTNAGVLALALAIGLASSPAGERLQIAPGGQPKSWTRRSIVAGARIFPEHNERS